MRKTNSVGICVQNAMGSVLRLQLLALALSLIAGCAGSTRNDLSTSSAISFSAPGFFLAPGSTLEWRSDLVYLFNDARKKPEDIKQFLQQEIQSYFESSDYIFSDDEEVAEYGLVAVVVLGDGLTAKDILKKFQLTPSFTASRRYEKGTIVVAIYNTSNEAVLWRGAIQANIDLDLPPDDRRERIRTHIKKLLTKVPKVLRT